MSYRAIYTVEEIVETLKRSYLPTVIVEGDDDIRWYRMLEERCSIGVDVIQAGGRKNLLGIFSQRSKYRVPVVFVADMDLWLFSGVPEEFADVVRTCGFSIENDILFESGIEKLFVGSEKTKFEKGMECLRLWFADQIKAYNKTNNCLLDTHPMALLDKTTYDFKDSSLRELYKTSLSKDDVALVDDIHLKLRGKNLLALYAMILSDRRGGLARHSKEAIVELAIQFGPSRLADDLMKRVKMALCSVINDKKSII